MARPEDNAWHDPLQGRAPLILGGHDFRSMTDAVVAPLERPTPLVWWLLFPPSLAMLGVLAVLVLGEQFLQRRFLVLQLLERLGQDARAVELIVLFGSLARQARAGSRGSSPQPRDIDLGVIYAKDATVRQRWRVEQALQTCVEGPVDVVDITNAPPLIRFEVARYATPLWEHRPYRWADFRAKAMVDWWDWAPIARKIHRAAIQRLRGEPVTW